MRFERDGAMAWEQEALDGERQGARPVLVWARDSRPPEALQQTLRVRPVHSVSALHAAVAEATPDLVVLDPGRIEDGWNALARLQQHPPPEALSLLVVAEDDDDGASVERAYALGAREVVTRSAPERELCARVAALQRRDRERRKLRALATSDGLTGLANFRSLNQRLEEEFKRSLRYRHAMAVVMIDLDHLKRLNDRHGHEAGNRALLGFVRHLRGSLREVDFAARFGGDEFVVILPHQTAAEAVIFAERLRQGLRQLRVPVRDVGQTTVGLTVSLGIADHTPLEPCVSAPELLESADAALYDAKLAGRDRLSVWRADPTTAPPFHGALQP